MKGGANRVLIVVGDQWTDPSSALIDSRVTVKEGFEDFEHITALLKIWGIPFDVLRLDQQNLSLSYLVDGEGDPLYGCIIWDADPTPFPKPGTKPRGRSDPSIMPYIPLTEEFIDHDYSALEKAVKEKGISLIGIGSRIGEETVQNLLGVKLTGKSAKKEEIKIEKEHFITRGMKGKSLEKIEFSRRREISKGSEIESESADIIAKDSDVLVIQSDYPILTARKLEGLSKTVWIGGPPNIFRNFIDMRFILRRSLVWCMGFSVYKDHEETVVLIMDDFGIVRKKATVEELKRARSRWKIDDERELTFNMWKYSAYNRKEIEEYYIKPLKERKAVLNHYVVSGIYRPEYNRIITPWLLKEKYDEKTVNNMASTLEGLKKGYEEGVFEIQDHGWTHHVVGPWRRLGNDPWPTSERRGVPGINLTFQYRSSRKSIENYFGFTPLASGIGRNDEESGLYHNGGIAAQKAGIVLACTDTYAGTNFVIYLGEVTHHIGLRYKSSLAETNLGRRRSSGYVINNVVFSAGSPMFSKTVPTLFRFHDRDVAYDQYFIRNLLKGLGQEAVYFGLNQYAAYLCSKISSSFDESIRLRFDYTDKGCLHFSNHDSIWTLHLSDEVRIILKSKGNLTIKVDEKVVNEDINVEEKIKIRVPEGQHVHSVKIGVRKTSF